MSDPTSSNWLFDVSDRVQIEMTGSDRAKFLHNFCSNDIKKLQPGQGCEAFVTNIKGKVVGHIFVFAEPESLWIESVPGSSATLISHLDRFIIREDVQLHDRSAEFAEFLLTGPAATNWLTKSSPGIADLPRYGHRTNVGSDPPVRSIRRVDWLGAPTWLMSVPVADRERICFALKGVGATLGNADQFHSCRITAGFPLFGADISEDNLAQEVGRTKLAISFTKGCYLGQEPIARIDAMGHVNRVLCRLKLPPDLPVAAGTEVFDKPAPDGKPIGTITSVAPLANESRAALAYVRSPLARAGQVVSVNQAAVEVFT